MSQKTKIGITALVLLMTVSAVQASSAGFVLRSLGIELGKVEEVSENGSEQPPRYHIKVEQGKRFTLIAQGRAYPKTRDVKLATEGQPTPPDEAEWRFDAKDFKVVPHAAKDFDETMSVIQLDPQVVGRTRIRFVGKVLNYPRQYDILVDIVKAKKTE